MSNVWHYKREIARGFSHNYVNFPAMEEKEGGWNIRSRVGVTREISSYEIKMEKETRIKILKSLFQSQKESRIRKLSN